MYQTKVTAAGFKKNTEYMLDISFQCCNNDSVFFYELFLINRARIPLQEEKQKCCRTSLHRQKSKQHLYFYMYVSFDFAVSDVFSYFFCRFIAE